MTSLTDRFKRITMLKTPWPYWVNHALIAVAIGWPFGNWWVGAAFYSGREIRDWQKLGYFDHAGFWAPVVACAAIEIFGR